ncbi:Mg(2+) transport ATPase protein C [Rhodovulum sp. P5]|uniref:MgtC/SapB family protein n=1 Tax=Rhodovulum sp. P5 TaxID=1564506 RepID=UPI0009C1F15F|nr:MgtC/SapB family protein [Rhodovulum sp. P5]ARE39333.1 Mg(2+) transport ATPase protein C [Rhodovulum sp. P5]
MLDNILSDLSDPFGGLPAEVALLRLVSATVLAGLIGLERQVRHKPAGLRTHMLIAMAACLATLVALQLIEAADPANATLRFDPLRLVGAITSGVAFLAAGAILTHGGTVEGLTTGAGMWLAGVIGLACGAGSIPLAATAALIALIVLALLRLVE